MLRIHSKTCIPIFAIALLLGQICIVSFPAANSSNSEFPPALLQSPLLTDNAGGSSGNLRVPERIPSDFGLNQIKEQILQQKHQEVTTSYIRAATLISSYQYEEALTLLNELNIKQPNNSQIHQLLARCQAGQAELEPYTGQIKHIFFHSLVVDPGKAFDGDKMSNGYNYWMATVDEFRKMLPQMRERGYILIDIHELYETVQDESGTPVFRRKFPLLPKGKKPLILSVDDINYYPFMEGNGFADRLVLDEHGNVAARYWVEGTPTIGEFDVVPILDSFVREHPDFSYRGAKGILALTGYMGVLGYRTQELNSEDYAARVEQLAKVVERLKQTGWLFASHGYGHLHSAQISLQRLQRDTDRWEAEVERLIGDSEIYIFPFGEEVPFYGEKLKYLQGKGFKVFCGVGSQNFLHVAKDYIRQARCDVDGYTMLKRPQHVTELFNVDEVVDHTRPTLK